MEAHLDSKKIIESLEIRADSLLATNRFDLGSKLACADWMKHSNSKLLATPLHPIYEAFTRAITQGHFSEPSSEKRGLEDYIESFESLHRKLVKEGFDETQGYIPKADDGSLLNGPHRSSILKKKKPIEPEQGNQNK